MSKAKKLVLSLSVFVTMLMALIVGVVSIKNDTNQGILASPLDNEQNIDIVEDIPVTYTYQPGEYRIEKGKDLIRYEYSPSVDTKASSNTVVYEYFFGSMDNGMAISLDSITKNTALTYRYCSSSSPLSDEEAITASSESNGEKLDKNVAKYMYIVITPKNSASTVTADIEVNWMFGRAAEVSVYNALDGKTTEKVVVKGQEVERVVVPAVPTGKAGYYFDGWFLDENFDIPATFPLTTYGQKLYARFANLPTSCLTLQDGEYIVTGNPGYSTIYIPSKVDGIPVTSVVGYEDEPGPFVFCSLELLDLPYTFTEIPAMGFAYSTINNINFPKTLKSIGSDAFCEIAGLTTLDLSDCVNLETMSYGAFCYAANLETIDFSGCVKLKTIPSSVFEYYNGATKIDLSGCTSLESIGANTFYCDYAQYDMDVDLSGCTSLKTIGNNAFYGRVKNLNLTGCTALGTIGEYAFYWSYGDTTSEPTMTSVDLSPCTKLKTIGSYAFSGQALTSLTIPRSVTHIGKGIVDGCENLQTLTFSNSSNWYKTTNQTQWTNSTGGEGPVSMTTNATNITNLKDYTYYWYRK